MINTSGGIYAILFIYGISIYITFGTNLPQLVQTTGLT
jgi:hypothetical protein